MDFGIVIKISQFVLSLSLLVVLHELGHFLPAKWFKTKVEKFYLFFDPYFSLIKKKIGETEYGIGWLPLGGYVKIAGMVDESMDTEQLKRDPEPWEFRSKPAWQRLIIMVGGVTVNFLLAWIIYSAMSVAYGVEKIDNAKLTHGIETNPFSEAMGFKSGDQVISIDDYKISDFKDLTLEFIKGEKAQVIREGKEVTFNINQAAQKEFTDKLKNKEIDPVSFRIPIVPIESIQKESSADKAGLTKGDLILKINETPVLTMLDIRKLISENKGKAITLDYKREGINHQVKIMLPEDSDVLGAEMGDKEYLESVVDYGKKSFVEAVPYGFTRTVSTITDQISGFKILGKEDGWKNLSGPIGIAKAFPDEWNWKFFWGFTAMLSAWLAFLNILPIPALDGGHIVFTLYEIISGRKPSQKVLEVAQMIGFIIMIGLFILIFGVDLFNIFS
ncbi:MAG: RIP metalloprotease RseP [Flavobacteriales bacterium]